MVPALLPVYNRANIDFSYGFGPYVFSNEGDKYLDFCAGYSALSLGHCHPKVVDALCDQAKKLWHLSNSYKIPRLLEYCKRLTAMSFADTVFMANSGAEAVECMIKMTRNYFHHKNKPHKYRIITIEGAFHGRTLACSSASSPKKMVGFGPPVEGFDNVVFNDINALKSAINDNTAAILLEPIQGEGGIRPHSVDYMKEVEKICRQEGILLLLDEVQCGMGRTGHMFAYEMYEIKPDIIALAKGLGAGFPISACLATTEIGKVMKVGTHGSTFGGNPLAIAVGHAVLDIISEKTFLKDVKEVSNYLKEKLEWLLIKHPKYIKSINGCGLMLGIKFKDEIDTEQVNYLFRKQFLLAALASDNVIRLTPPLIIKKQHCDEALNKIDLAIEQYNNLPSKIGYKLNKVMSKLKN